MKTLRRHRDSVVSKAATLQLGNYQTIFPLDIEKKLVEYIQETESHMLDLILLDV